MSRAGHALILGAGVTGLSTAWKLAQGGMRVTVLERDDHPGGLASTFRHGPFLLDLGPHKLTTLMPEIMQEVKDLIGDELLCVPKQTRIYLQGKFLNYPVRARDLFTGMRPGTGLKCSFSYMAAVLRKIFSSPADNSYYDWVVNRFGVATAELVFNCFARKLWGDPRLLSKELAETRIALPSLFQVLVQMVLGFKKKGVVIATDDFLYPKYGTITLAQKLAQKVEQCGGRVVLGCAVTGVEHDGTRMTAVCAGDQRFQLGPDDVVVGTIPLRLLTGFMQPGVPPKVSGAVSELKTRNLILVYLVVNLPRITQDNWIFFPEEKYLFNRAYEQKGFSPFMGPEDKTVLCLEITPEDGGPVWNTSDAELADQCLAQLESIGLLRRHQVEESFAVRLKGVYQVYDTDFRRKTETVFGYLDSFENFYSIGRHGGFNYVGQCDCMDMGFRTAQHITDAPKTGRAALRAQFDNYAVLD